MKIGMTSIYVNDPTQAYKFYTEVLGFAGHMFVPEMRLAIVVSPEQPDGPMLLLEPNDDSVAKTHQEGLYRAGLPEIVLTTQDIHKEYERLSALDVAFRKPPTKTDWGLEAVFDDTCGNFVQLHQL